MKPTWTECDSTTLWSFQNICVIIFWRHFLSFTIIYERNCEWWFLVVEEWPFCLLFIFYFGKESNLIIFGNKYYLTNMSESILFKQNVSCVIVWLGKGFILHILWERKFKLVIGLCWTKKGKIYFYKLSFFLCFFCCLFRLFFSL